MTVSLPPDGRPHVSTDPFPSYSDPNTSPPPEPLLVASPTAPAPPLSTIAANSAAKATAPSRDPSLTRGRALSATSRNASPRSNTSGPAPHSSARSKHSVDLERKPSVSYGHHRQTSIVHGVQHSRNPSLLASSNASPISPNKILQSAGLSDAPTSNGAASLKKSPSMSALHTNGMTVSTGTSTNKSSENGATQRIPARMHSGRVKRSHERQLSQSRTSHIQGQELKTVGEYALHHLFTSFIAEADEKIEKCMQRPGEPEPRVESICGPGVDFAFDQLISSLGHINRHKPNSLIDSVIHWRKKKADLANTLYMELKAMKDSAATTQRAIWNGAYATPSSPPGGNALMLMEQNVAISDRRSTVSIYILCRVLIEIVGQTTLKALDGPDNTAGRLEDVIYSQVLSADPDLAASSPVIRANWAIRSQLLGVMSGIRFEEVSERFIKDLEGAQRRLAIKGNIDTKLASKTALLVQSMRWLKFGFLPEDAWLKSCEVLQVLAKFFAEVHGRTMKHAYAELFEHLILPIAASATTQLNTPKWKEVVALIQPKLTQMLSKTDHWPHVYPLQAVLLCASPTEAFATHWLNFTVNFQPKQRDLAGRSHALKAICRVVWRYLYRSSESPNQVTRKLDEIVKLVFQGGKRMISTVPVIADPLIQLIRIIGYKQQDFCFRQIIFPLMNSELFSGPEKELRIENLDPEKTVIAIRAFLAIMSDMERSQPPPFPIRFECDSLTDPTRAPTSHRRTHSQGFAVSAGRTERLSRPVMTINLNEITKEYYIKFCKILGQLTIICDNTFGGQAVLDEKFSTQPSKTPMAEAFTFNKKDDLMYSQDLRQNYYDLLHVAVEALPRCLSPHLPINSLVNLLCTGTAHVQSHIATSSAQSLKSIARQSHAQQVTIGFARFIFNFDDRYATVSDGSLLGPGHIENTLQLYVELLQIWIDDIQERTREVTTGSTDQDEQSLRSLPLDLSGVLAHVDEVESHGLFFLCSPSRAVRAVAVKVLRLITKFDTALGKPCTRIISILEGSSQHVIDVNDERLTLAERSRLQKGLRKSNVNSTLVELCSSDVAHDANLWFKVFPNLVRLSSEICLHAVALTRELVCLRLSHSYRRMYALSEGSKQTTNALEQAFASKMPNRVTSTAPDVIIEQWKIHLIFACTTLTNIGGAPNHLPASHMPASSQSSQHTRKSSKSSAASQEKIASATELFSKVIHFLSVGHEKIRAAAVAGLGATNATLFRTLLETLQPLVSLCTSEAKERLASHQRSTSNPRRNVKADFLRTEITHLLSLTVPLLQNENIAGDSYIMHYVNDYVKHLRIFLSDVEIQGELGFQKLRTHFCALVDGLYDSVRTHKDGSHWMSFQSRQATFALMENWCGFSPNEPHIRRQHEHVRRSVLEREGDARQRVSLSSQMEKDKMELQFAALGAMATLCAGPLRFAADNRLQFDLRRMLAWINAIYESPSDRTHAIGRKALQKLIVHNPDQPYLMAQAIRMCYIARLPKALGSYFEVVTQVLTENTSAITPFWKIVCAGLYTLGNQDSDIRMKSVRLLRTLEERVGKTSKLQDLDISVSDKTTAVYKLAQFEISQRLASLHPELAFHVFSEFSAYFNELQPDHQRNMVSGMLPWIQTIELQLDPNGGPTATSYMLLVNLFEITVKSRTTLHNEIQALWQALATGPYAGNVQVVLNFIIQVCLDKKEQNFVIYAKQIVVFLSKTPAGARVVEYLLMQICPKNMIAERKAPTQVPSAPVGLPHIADLSVVLPSGGKQNGLSLGQLSLVLLVDLVVSPFQLQPSQVPVLLQIILVQWDHHVAVVQDHAREMLVHLIHELIISKIDPSSTEPDKKSIEDFIECVRRHDPKIAWTYADSDVRRGEEDSRAVSEPMAYVVDEVVRIFSVTYPTIREDLGKVTIEWATSCAVRHVACRSFQVFRCVSTTLDQKLLKDMLARLSNTIADVDNHDYLVFSVEILTTLRSIIDALEPLHLLKYPQLFWTTCACLDTVFEQEFQEGLSMLSLILSKMDLSDPAVVKILVENRPPQWQGGFQGVHSLLYKGVRSSNSMDRSLLLMERLIKLPSSEIVGSDERLLFTMLANLPRYLHCFDDNALSTYSESAETLALAAEGRSHMSIARVLQGFAQGKYRSEKDFLSMCITAIHTTFFPVHEFRSLVFLLGMVNNAAPWLKVKTMQILCVMIPDIDMQKPEIASQGPDLISPLLRLLPTEHCQQALDVLDNVIDMTGTPLDNQHLRMSMAGSHSSRATRKEYDHTQSLYGIPEESGWSIPMPASHSSHTRANVTAVFLTLTFAGINGVPDATMTTTPEIEFYKDDYAFDSYFADRTITMLSDESRTAESNVVELAEKLDTLDDFFDDPSPSDHFKFHDPSVPLGLGENDHYRSDTRESLYDQQALPILQGSLKRNASITSFHHGLAEHRYVPPREQRMTPGAFAQPGATPPGRPGMHSRSITSPVYSVTATRPYQPHDVASGDDTADEPFSDGSDYHFPISRTHTADEPSAHQRPHAYDTIRPSGGLKALKSGIRRLTSSGGNKEARDQFRAAAVKTPPKVPKVPAGYGADAAHFGAEP